MASPLDCNWLKHSRHDFPRQGGPSFSCLQQTDTFYTSRTPSLTGCTALGQRSMVDGTQATVRGGVNVKADARSVYWCGAYRTCLQLRSQLKADMSSAALLHPWIVIFQSYAWCLFPLVSENHMASHAFSTEHVSLSDGPSGRHEQDPKSRETERECWLRTSRVMCGRNQIFAVR